MEDEVRVKDAEIESIKADLEQSKTKKTLIRNIIHEIEGLEN